MNSRVHVYVAGASSERARSEAMAEKIRSTGCVLTHPWWDVFTELEAAGRLAHLTPSERLAHANADLAGVLAADLIVFLHPTPGHSSKGMWTELGFALGLREAGAKYQKLWVVGEPLGQRFFSLKAERHFEDDEECFVALRQSIEDQDFWYR